MRMAGGDNYSIYCGSTLIATASGRRAYMDNFKGAVYMHRGNSFLIKSVDKAKKDIMTEPFTGGNYYTMPTTDKNTMDRKIYLSEGMEGGWDIHMFLRI